MNNAYYNLAYYYDEMQKDIDYDVWQKWLINEIKDGDQVLEIGCGTGIIANFLSKNNIDIDAFDLSSEMIEVAKNKYNKINFYIDDIRTFKTTKKYSHVICFMDTFNYLLNIEDLKSAFLKIYECLNSGGVLLFDIHQPSNIEVFENYFETGVVLDKTYEWKCQTDKKNKVRHELCFGDSCELHEQWLFNLNIISKCFKNHFLMAYIKEDNYRYYLKITKK